MIVLRPLSALLVACALISGCVYTNEPDETQGLGDTVKAVLAKQLGRGDAEVVDARQVITPAVLATATTPVLLVVQRNIDLGVTMVPVGTGADGTVQWRDSTGAGLLTRGGVLVGTRGIGFDLHTVDAGGLRDALAQGGGSDVLRVERRIRGDSVIVEDEFFCDVVPTGSDRVEAFGRAYAATRFEERCAGATGTFVNRYWIGGGIVRKAEVFVSPVAGIVELTLIAD